VLDLNFKPDIKTILSRFGLNRIGIIIMQERPEIEFPVTWHYKIIVSESSAREELNSLLKKMGYDVEVSEGNSSRTGKFQAFRASVILSSQQAMDELSSALGSLDSVKFLL